MYANCFPQRRASSAWSIVKPGHWRSPRAAQKRAPPHLKRECFKIAPAVGEVVGQRFLSGLKSMHPRTCFRGGFSKLGESQLGTAVVVKHARSGDARGDVGSRAATPACISLGQELLVCKHCDRPRDSQLLCNRPRRWQFRPRGECSGKDPVTQPSIHLQEERAVASRKWYCQCHE